jgi:hypothetical protein
MVLEAAVNGRADAVVTFNVRDYGTAASQFGVEVLLPRWAFHGRVERLAVSARRVRCQNLLVENDQMILGAGQFSDTDRIAPEHFGRNPSWIITGTENDDLGARDLPQQTFKIAVCRDQDEVVSGGVVRNPAIAGTGKPVLKGTLRLGE